MFWYKRVLFVIQKAVLRSSTDFYTWERSRFSSLNQHAFELLFHGSAKLISTSVTRGICIHQLYLLLNKKNVYCTSHHLNITNIQHCHAIPPTEIIGLVPLLRLRLLELLAIPRAPFRRLQARIIKWLGALVGGWNLSARYLESLLGVSEMWARIWI